MSASLGDTACRQVWGSLRVGKFGGEGDPSAALRTGWLGGRRGRKGKSFFSAVETSSDLGRDGGLVFGGLVFFCGGNEGWFERGTGGSRTARTGGGGGRVFMGGMVAGKGDFWQWEGGTKGWDGRPRGTPLRGGGGRGDGPVWERPCWYAGGRGLVCRGDHPHPNLPPSRGKGDEGRGWGRGCVGREGGRAPTRDAPTGMGPRIREDTGGGWAVREPPLPERGEGGRAPTRDAPTGMGPRIREDTEWGEREGGGLGFGDGGRFGEGFAAGSGGFAAGVPCGPGFVGLGATFGDAFFAEFTFPLFEPVVDEFFCAVG